MKLQFTLLSFIALFLSCFPINLQAQTKPIPSWERGLIAHFPMTIDFKDTTRYQQHGTNHGAEFKGQERCGAGAFYFDGKAHVACGHHRIFDREHRELAVSMWINPDGIATPKDFFGMLIGKWAFNPEKDQFAVFMNRHHKIVMSIGDGKKHAEGIHSRRKLHGGKWYHIVAQYRAPNIIQIYVNGKLDSEGRQEGTSGMNTNSADVPLHIGRQKIKLDRPYAGFMSSARIYRRFLAADEVKELFEYENSVCQRFNLEGDVLNEETMQPIEGVADIILKDLESEKEIARTKSDDLDGYYKLELPVGHYYGVFAKAENYKYVSVNTLIDTRNMKLTSAPGEISEETQRRDLFMVPFEVGKKVRVNNLFFDTGKSNLKQESYAELNFLLEMFNDIPTLVLEIGGHTDNVGAADNNQRLSQSRAESVRQYLISKGVGADRVKAKGYGENQPVADNETDYGRKMNRRVEFTILAK